MYPILLLFHPVQTALVSNRHQGVQEGEARRREWESLEGSLCAQLAERTSEVLLVLLYVFKPPCYYMYLTPFLYVISIKPSTPIICI
jgi:hypothetical protein